MKRIILIGLIIIYPLLFIWQGLDFTDMGYSISNSYFIFDHPEFVERGFILWLTNIIGGIWLHYFDDLGVIGFRFASVLVIYITLYFTYLILKEMIAKKILLIYMLVSLILIERIFWIHYNHLTALFFVVGFYLLLRGLKSKKTVWIFLSGMFMGASILIRFPNILGVSFILLIWLFYDVRGKIKNSILFIIGYVFSIALAYISMIFLNHDKLFLDSIMQIFHSASGSGSHGTTNLMDIYIEQFKGILLVCLSISMLFIIQIIILSIARTVGNRFSIISIILLVPIVLYFYETLYDRDAFLTGVCGFIIFTLVLAFYIERKDPLKRTIIFAALLILLLIPLGSDIGIRNSGFGMYLAIPLVFYYKHILLKNVFFQYRKDDQPVGFSVFMPVAISIIITTFGLVDAYTYTYRDSPNRHEMVHSVDHPKLKGVFTTKERAQIVEELLTEIPKHSVGDGTLLAVEAVPMLHYLTGMKPYMYATWPMLNEPPQFAGYLKRAQSEQKDLPTVILTKERTTSFTWPDDSGKITNPRYIKNREIVQAFLNDHSYQKKWDNEFFEIYTPR